MLPILVEESLRGPLVEGSLGAGLSLEVEGRLEVEGWVEDVEEVRVELDFFIVHLLFPFLKVMGRAWICMQRFVCLAFLEAFSLLASLERDESVITLSSCRAAEGEVKAESVSAGALSRAPFLSLKSSLPVHVVPWLAPGAIFWGERVVPGGAVHVITASSALLPSLLQYGV